MASLKRILLTYHSDYDIYGFRRDEILSILQKHGIDLDIEESGRAADLPPASAQDAEWKQALARRRRLSVFEAVCAMGGIDPFTEAETVENYGVNGAVYDMNKALLDEAIDDGLIISFEKREGNHTKYFIEVESFSAWCDKRNIPRPLPWVFETATPSTDPELRQALEDAKNEVAALKTQVQALTEQLAEMGLGKDYAGILDQNNAFHPPELFVAMNAWRAVMANGDPRALGKGVTDALTTWLDDNKNKYGLSNKAIGRLATVANWNKGGGTPPTPS